MNAAISVAMVIGALTACASGSESALTLDALSAADARMLQQIAPIAARDAKARHADAVDCWVPSQHEIESEPAHFKVLCRVRFDEGDESRQRDMICIGAYEDDPPLEYCYDWAYYTDMPTFEDSDAARIELHDSH